MGGASTIDWIGAVGVVPMRYSPFASALYPLLRPPSRAVALRELPPLSFLLAFLANPCLAALCVAVSSAFAALLLLLLFLFAVAFCVLP